jgi:hypothetical protein
MKRPAWGASDLKQRFVKIEYGPYRQRAVEPKQPKRRNGQLRNDAHQVIRLKAARCDAKTRRGSLRNSTGSSGTWPERSVMQRADSDARRLP